MGYVHANNGYIYIMATGNPNGRPLKYTDVEVMKADIEEYFIGDAFMGEGDNRVFAPTVSGLAYHLDMSTECFRNYEEKDEFFATVKRAKQRIEIALEQRLAGNNVTGSIFNLKNNFGWKDKSEVDNSTVMKVEAEVALRPQETREEYLARKGL